MKKMIVRKEFLIPTFFNGSPIQLPVLDKESFNIFFEPNDILSSRVDKIHSMMFLYIKEGDGHCPLIKCKINYNMLGMEFATTGYEEKYFIYDEVTDSMCANFFQQRLEKYAAYLDGYFGKCYDERISNNKKGLELSFITEFFEKIGCMGQYLIPKEDILKEIGSDYVITHKKFC